MTLPELIAELWARRAVVTLRPDGSPSVKPPEAARDLLPALKEHREAIIETLRGIHGASLEGLVCATCDPSVTAPGFGPLRWCDKCRWATQHFPRRGV